MGFLDFKQLNENSLYSSATEKDSLLKDKQRLMDAFYLNFFGFVGLFSINQLAPLKKYEQSEGKLFVDNIADTNHDVSLAIKLLYDEKLIQRSIVDKMTKLLVKIKTKQIKPEELDEKFIREMLIDMHYTSHRGTVHVMQPIMDFADGKIQLKHLAYQLYMVAKKKQYQDITKELRSIGVYYSVWFKKVDAHLAPTSNSSTQPAVVTPVAQSAVQPVQQTASTVVQPVAAAIKTVQPKGKTDEFWFHLYNARGKVEIKKVHAEYGVEFGSIKGPEYAAGIQAALRTGGDIDLNSLEKSYLAIQYGSKLSSFVYTYMPLWTHIIDNAKTITDFIEPISRIAEAKARDTITYSYFNSTVIEATTPFGQKIIKVLKEYISKDVSNVRFTVETSKLLQGFFLGVLRRHPILNIFTLEEAIKLKSLFNVVNIGEIRKEILSKYFNVTLSSWERFYVTKSIWESSVPSDVRKLLENSTWFGELGISISDVADFNTAIKKVVDYVTFSEFNRNVVVPMLKISGADKLDEDKSMTLLKQVIDNIGGFISSINTAYENLRNTIQIRNLNQGRHWSADFWEAVYNNIIDSFKSGKTKFEDLFVNLQTLSNGGNLPPRFNVDKEQFSKRAEDYYIDYYKRNTYVYFSGSEIVKEMLSPTFIDRFISETVDAYFERYNYQTFTGIKKSDIKKETITKVLEKWFQGNFEKNDSIVKVILAISNKEEFAEVAATFINSIWDKIDPQKRKPILRTLVKYLDSFKLNKQQLEETFDYNTIIGSLYELKDNEQIMDHFGKKFKERLLDDSVTGMGNEIVKIVRTDQKIIENILTDDLTNDQVSSLLEKSMSLLGANVTKKFNRKDWNYVSKESYGFELKCSVGIFNSLGARVFGVPEGEQAVEKIAEILSTPSKIEKEYRESVVTDISNLFTNVDVNPDTEKAFSKFEKKTQKMLAANFALAQFAGAAVKEINENAVIKPRSVLPSKGALKVLKLNQVTIPANNIIDFRKLKGKDATLKEIQEAAIGAAKSFTLEKQAVEEVQLSEVETEKMSVVLNKFNRYKHGGIAVKIRKVFNVSIGSQQIGWKEFLAEYEAVKNSGAYAGKYYYKFPQFHGTASLPASMILRYGFSVIDEKLAREAGIKYAGRMLGDGIYSSNVLDKVAQYINDDAPTGVSRHRGAVGYIFEMETQGSVWGRSCNVAGADFATGGTGEFMNERGGLVSPEWAWKYANRQCRVKRCFEIELVDKKEMDALVSKHKDVMEAVGYKSFEEYLAEAKRPKVTTNQNYIQATFMDNIVPVGNGKYIDLNEEDESKIILPKRSFIDHGQYGVCIHIPYEESVSFKLLYGSDIETNAEIRKLYFSAIKKK